MHSLPNISHSIKRHCFSNTDNIRSFIRTRLTYSARKKNLFPRVDREEAILSFSLDEFCRRGGEFRGLADDHLSRTSPARFRVPSASQVSAFTLRSRAEISRVRARAHTREDFSGNARSCRATCSRDHRTRPWSVIDTARGNAPRRETKRPASRHLATRLSRAFLIRI